MQNNRYQIHFSPEKGWMNDPNGLIYVDGIYHLFYQHYPNDTKWGPMHWGHATSTDLICWEHQPIALFPTEDEYIFSGSAILDENNLLGFSENGKKTMVLFYTSHNPKTGEQMQSLAYSTDYIHFKKYSGNPVLKNSITSPDYKKDFRDPKVFPNTVLGGYSMVLAVNEAIEFYHSTDFINWSYTGAFYPKEFGYAGLCECPDLFSLSCEEGTKTILSMSMIFTKEGQTEETHIMQYFIGEFNGNTFINGQTFDETQLLDFGKDNYAMVTFANISRPIMLGWGEDWNQARKNTADTFFGKTTLARSLSLVSVHNTLKISQSPILTTDAFSAKKNDNLWTDTCRLEVGQAKNYPHGLNLTNQNDILIIGSAKIKRNLTGVCKISIYYDHGYYEIFADDGLISYSEESSHL